MEFVFVLQQNQPFNPQPAPVITQPPPMFNSNNFNTGLPNPQTNAQPWQTSAVPSTQSWQSQAPPAAAPPKPFSPGPPPAHPPRPDSVGSGRGE